MKLVSYIQPSGIPSIGALTRDGTWVADINYEQANQTRIRYELNTPVFHWDMCSFLKGGDKCMKYGRDAIATVESKRKRGDVEELQNETMGFPLSLVRLVAPVPRPRKLLALWVNYPE